METLDLNDRSQWDRVEWSDGTPCEVKCEHNGWFAVTFAASLIVVNNNGCVVLKPSNFALRLKPRTIRLERWVNVVRYKSGDHRADMFFSERSAKSATPEGTLVCRAWKLPIEFPEGYGLD